MRLNKGFDSIVQALKKVPSNNPLSRIKMQIQEPDKDSHLESKQ